MTGNNPQTTAGGRSITFSGTGFGVTTTATIGGKPVRANFFRVDRSETHGDEYSAWNPTMKDPADFHVVAAFGKLEFD